MKKQISLKSLICVMLVLAMAICLSVAAFALPGFPDLTECEDIAPSSGGMEITDNHLYITNTKFSSDTIAAYEEFDTPSELYTLEFECRTFTKSPVAVADPGDLWSSTGTIASNLPSYYTEFDSDDITIGCFTNGLDSTTSYYASWTLTPTKSSLGSTYMVNFECEFGERIGPDSWPYWYWKLKDAASFNTVYFW